MRTIPLFLLLATTGLLPSARAANDYVLSTATAQAYTPLTGATVLAPDPVIYIGYATTIPIGFTFNYWGVDYTTFNVSTYAYCVPGGGGTFGFYPFYTNLVGLGDSQIRYVLDTQGGVGARILKVEWHHVGFLADVTATDNTTFQIWLREGSNAVEFHFGPSNIAPAHYQADLGSSAGTQVAFSDPSGTSFYNLQGPTDMPTAVYLPQMFIYLSGYPGNGTTYTFSPAAMAGIQDVTADEAVVMYPQPAVDRLHVALPGATAATRYTLWDARGVLSGSGPLDPNGMDLTSLPAGVYILRLTDGTRSITRRFLHSAR